MIRRPPRSTLFPTRRSSDLQLVARKFGAAHAKGLVPILCVGEQLADRDAGRTHEVDARQLDVVLELCGAGALELGVVAYERSEEHTSELQSQSNLVCRLLLE